MDIDRFRSHTYNNILALTHQWYYNPCLYYEWCHPCLRLLDGCIYLGQDSFPLQVICAQYYPAFSSLTTFIRHIILSNSFQKDDRRVSFLKNKEVLKGEALGDKWIYYLIIRDKLLNNIISILFQSKFKLNP